MDTRHQPYSDFPSFTCECALACLYLILNNLVTCWCLYPPLNQDMGGPCVPALLSGDPSSFLIMVTIHFFSISKILLLQKYYISGIKQYLISEMDFFYLAYFPGDHSSCCIRNPTLLFAEPHSTFV